MAALSPRRQVLWAAALLISAAAVLSHEYVARVDRSNPAARFDLHRQIVEGSAVAPYRYRVLVPFICQGLASVLQRWMTPSDAFTTAYATYDFIAIALLLMMLYVYLRLWFSASPALSAVLFAGSTMTIGFRDHYFQPWSLLEPALLAFGLLAIYRRRRVQLAATIAVATLNRETAFCIPLAFLFAHWTEILNAIRHRRSFAPALLAGCYFGIWFAVFLGIRIWRGEAQNIHTLSELWTMNVAPDRIGQAVINIGLFLGAFWAIALAGWRRAPSFVRRVGFVIPVYLGTVAAWGVWTEVRLLMTTYPLLLPLGLSWVYPPDGQR